MRTQEGGKSLRPLPPVPLLGSSKVVLGSRLGRGWGMGDGNGVAFSLWDPTHRMWRYPEKPQGA